MKIEQFIYGRVSRGLQAGGGYQSAAASPEVWDNRELQELLRTASYYPRTTRTGARRPRYAFCPVGDDWYSLSRTAIAKDLTNSVGYFAHHLLVRATEIHQVGWLPLRLLREFPFHSEEAELAADRRLPSLDLRVAAPEAPDRQSPDFERVLLAARVLGDSSGASIPVLITGEQSDEMVLRFVEQVLSLFPVKRGLTMAFCSNFTSSAENLAYYRFVTAPEVSDLPEPTENFQVISPERAASVLPAPFIDWVARSQASPAEIQKYLLACARGVDMDEAMRVELLANSAFESLPAALERQWPEWAQEALVENPRLFGLYYDRIPDWRIEPLAASFSVEPFRVGEAVLALTRHPAARQELANWIVQSVVVRHRDSLELMRWADQNGLLEEVARIAPRLSSEEIVRLAEVVLSEERRTSAIYHMLARLVLGGKLTVESERRLTGKLLAPRLIVHFPGLASLLEAWQTVIPGKAIPGTATSLIPWDDIDESDYGVFVQELSQRLARSRSVPPDKLPRLLHPRFPDLAVALALSAFRCQADVRHILSVESRFQLNAAQRNSIVVALAQSSDHRAVREYVRWAELQRVELTNEQLQSLQAASSSSWKNLWQRIWPGGD
jgi:hypothetical protein